MRQIHKLNVLEFDSKNYDFKNKLKTYYYRILQKIFPPNIHLDK